MDNNNFFDASDLEGVLAEFNNMEDIDEPLTPEEEASQRRYEEIIKKHKNGQV